MKKSAVRQRHPAYGSVYSFLGNDEKQAQNEFDLIIEELDKCNNKEKDALGVPHPEYFVGLVQVGEFFFIELKRDVLADKLTAELVKGYVTTYQDIVSKRAKVKAVQSWYITFNAIPALKDIRNFIEGLRLKEIEKAQKERN